MLSIAVIGGGPAGMMAALSAAKAGADVTILEHSPAPGAKLLLTGGGRCNFSHDCTAREFVSILGRRGRFIGHALAALDPVATRELFAGSGIPSVVESDGRVVPASQRAVDLRRALVESLSAAGVHVCTGFHVNEIRNEKDAWAVIRNGERALFDRVILATGGMSYADTGSDGSGFAMARALGHEIVNPVPAEVPLVTIGLPLERLQGLTLHEVEMAVAGRKNMSSRGNLLFTHFGISGPAVLDISADVSELVSRGVDVTVMVNLLPEIDDDSIIACLERGPGALRSLLPQRLAAVVYEMAAGLPPERRLALVRKFPIRIARTRGFDTAMVTRGGVDLREVDPANMQSRLHEGLFFAGEILDLDGPMGGFNLQIAWSTGWLAGRSAAGA